MGAPSRKAKRPHKYGRGRARRGSLAPLSLLGQKVEPKTENEIQEAVWSFLATIKFTLVGVLEVLSLQDISFHVPNGIQLAGASAKRRAIYMAALKRRGLKPGVSDLVIPYPSRGYHGMFLELKAKDGIESGEQNSFRVRMSKLGYYADIVYSYEAAVQSIRTYLEIP